MGSLTHASIISMDSLTHAAIISMDSLTHAASIFMDSLTYAAIISMEACDGLIYAAIISVDSLTHAAITSMDSLTYAASISMDSLTHTASISIDADLQLASHPPNGHSRKLVPDFQKALKKKKKSFAIIMEMYLPLSSNDHNRSKKMLSKSNNLPHHSCTHHVQIHLQTDVKIQEPASSPVLCHAAGLRVTLAGNQCVSLFMYSCCQRVF